MADEIERAAGLLQRAFADGELSDESAQALVAVGDIGTEVAQALGVSEAGDDLFLVTLLVDDSYSIGTIEAGASAVRQGHNQCLEAVAHESGVNVMVHTRYLNSGVVTPYRSAVTATRLNSANYQPAASRTPLYRQCVVTLGTVMAKVREEKEGGRQIRAFTLIITDGEDNEASAGITAQHVRCIVRDMLEFSDDYIVAGMGIGEPAQFRQVFGEMGIPGGWILTADATPEEISAVFRRIAKSLRLAASGDAGWLQLESGLPLGD